MAPLKVFAFDHASAGGPAPGAGAGHVPASLRHKGALMLAALCADLRRVPGIELITLDDPVDAADSFDSVSAISSAAAHGYGQPSFMQRFTERVLAADAVWPLAPEANGVLEQLSHDVLRHERILLGSSPAAVKVAASKRATFAALVRAGVPTVPTFAPGDPLPDNGGAWVAKPDDGAGCLDTRLFADSGAARAWTGAHGRRDYVLQPFIGGRAGSLSLLCCFGSALVLSRNEQRIAVHDNQFHFLGSTVNGLAGTGGELDALALRVAAALPGLWGYAGVDIILAAGGALVLDVNPRLTVSYAGLHTSIACNPAALVLELLGGTLPGPDVLTRALPVSVDVAAFGVR